ncbi:hypothetical protein [Paenibacillus sp. NAIST15-1]|uniref:hypothetical protein n=1 Tax=Paenibacillus sp. NAIST15-1 TaxID=1605994 RepID=UPI00086E1197|nr:hypothetical protein [Paenibacillus sp. NAIST15-1]GAV11444.1 hypothetical protein PBN151_1373 [Paenibacillus sp. NAIST15-1]
MNSLKRMLQLYLQLEEIENEIAECESNLLGSEIKYGEYGLCTIIFIDGNYATLACESDDDDDDDDDRHEIEVSLEELVK